MNKSILFELEDELIPSSKWDDEMLSHFPDNIQKQITNGIPEPIGIGYREDVGWFCMGSGQGPHLIWSEREV